jgi:hypothetical protein
MLNQQVFSITSEYCLFSGDAENTNFTSLWFDPTGDQLHDLPRDTDISFGLFNIFTYLDMSFG